MRKINWAERAGVVFLLWTTTAVALPAQRIANAPDVTFTTLHTFDNKDGSQSDAALIQGTDGGFYGTESIGGANIPCSGGTGCGTVFNITPSGKLTFLSFNYTDGANPEAALVQAPDGNFYGTAIFGGTYGSGNIFKITKSGVLTTIYSFCSQGGDNCADGLEPFAGLVRATNGNFYGTTNYGGANTHGTVYKVTPSGALTTLYSFCAAANCADGYSPNGVVEGADGNFYGTTFHGGVNATCQGQTCGTVFKITPSGVLTTLHSFGGTDGENPDGALIQAADGNFYGTTLVGGANENEFCPYGCGTVFKITSSGALTTLHSFSEADGSEPVAIIQATDNNFYGPMAELTMTEQFFR